MSNLFTKAAEEKHKNFYNNVETLYKYLKKKYDPNGQHSSIMKSLGIRNGDEIIIRAQTTDNGAVIEDSVTINKESIKPIESNPPNSKVIEHVNVNVDDFDDDWNDVDSISSSETIEPGNSNSFNNEKIISPEENAVNDYIKTIKQIYNLTHYISNKIETIDAVKLGRIQQTENTEKFTNKIYEIIEVFQRYIINIFSNINKINGNVIYHNIFEIIKKKGYNLVLERRKVHFTDNKNKFNGYYKNNIIRKDFQSVLQQEKEFLRIIKGECKYLYDIIIQNKNMINEKYINVYTSANEKIIENINEKIHDDDEGFNALYKKIFSPRPSSAPHESNTKSNTIGSNNNNLEVSKDDKNPLNVKRGWFGGSNKKKYTIKRHPNKKYTISKKIKNARLNKTRNRNIRNKNKTRMNKYI